jgi:hypothetical protein
MAVMSSCTSASSNRFRRLRAMPRRNRQRSWLVFDMRALTIIMGTPRLWVSQISAGHKLTFAPYGKIGAPMVEKARHEGARVQRDVLMNRPFGQSFGHNAG